MQTSFPKYFHNWAKHFVFFRQVFFQLLAVALQTLYQSTKPKLNEHHVFSNDRKNAYKCSKFLLLRYNLYIVKLRYILTVKMLL